MDRKTFFQQLHQFDSKFEEAGFIPTKKRDEYLSGNNIRLHVILDKWGWNPQEGWGFNVRVADMNKTVGELGNVHPNDQLDLKPAYFIESKKINESLVKDTYNSLPKKLIDEFYEGWWYKFSDEESLRKVLDNFLPFILSEAREFRNPAK